MRQGHQHRRGRGRNNNVNSNMPGNRKGQNPLTRSFESNGPDVKVRGTPAHVAEKYLQLARDAQSSGDHVLAENYLQHAEHYNRIILAYREQQIQQSGEMMNGNGRHHPGMRPEAVDGGDGGHDDVGDERMGGSEQPMYVRQPGAEQPPSDLQPMLDEAREPREPRHQQRHGEHQRFRERHPRHERHDRGERQGQAQGQEGFERGERHERQGGERGFDRHRERPFRQPEGGHGEAREMRQHREPREPREPRPMPQDPLPREAMARDVPRDVPREIGPAGGDVPGPSAPPPGLAEDVPPAPRAEGGQPRRRERFGLGPDQPDFLRRPVRRVRREPEADFAADAPPPSPPTDETPRE